MVKNSPKPLSIVTFFRWVDNKAAVHTYMWDQAFLFKWCKQKIWNYFSTSTSLLIGWEETATVCKGVCAINSNWTVQIETRPSMFAQDALCIYILLLEFGSKQWHTKGARMAVFKYLCCEVFHWFYNIVGWLLLSDCALLIQFCLVFLSLNLQTKCKEFLLYLYLVHIC